MSTQLTPILTRFWDDPRSWTLETYEQHDGYQGLRNALAMPQADLVQLTKDSGLRGRGGAGFPTGMKWGFLPPPDGGPRYLVVNADESEPGTCKDIPLMMAAPQLLIEGVAITVVRDRLQPRVHLRPRRGRPRLPAPAARGRGGLRRRLPRQEHPGLGLRPRRHRARRCRRLHLRRGDGAAGLPRGPSRPAAPEAAVPGRRRASTPGRPWSTTSSPSPRSPRSCSTASKWFTDMGTERSHRLRHLQPVRPRQAARPVRGAARHHAARAAGHGRRHARPAHEAEVLDPRRVLDADLHRRAPRRAAGLRVGGRGGLDARHPRAADLRRDHVSVVRAVDRWTDFYAHESCGKCTPCREGTFWLKQILERLEHGHGAQDDIDKLLDICDNILGRAFCALGDGATSPITSAVKYFREEFEAGMHTSAAELPLRRRSPRCSRRRRCPHDRHRPAPPRVATPSTRAATRRSRPPSTWST